jgi:hypothetical protein
MSVIANHEPSDKSRDFVAESLATRAGEDAVEPQINRKLAELIRVAVASDFPQMVARFRAEGTYAGPLLDCVRECRGQRDSRQGVEASPFTPSDRPLHGLGLLHSIS